MGGVPLGGGFQERNPFRRLFCSENGHECMDAQSDKAERRQDEEQEADRDPVEGGLDDAVGDAAVSYTHLTLPTIYSV